MEPENKFASLFGNNPDISLDERVRVVRELEKVGSLTFAVERDGEGWTAICNEIAGIIAGNTNPNPSDVEIESQIREAIYAAFNVKFDKNTKESTPSPFSFEYSLN